ncbi:V-type ATP synthase subunit F [Candidatus Micrarchaeota archaeon]|nr:V-type ATP synthase subunit F [Candidatus Micrarchaeota archaeon]
MKSKIVVVGDAPLVMGFKLAGIDDTVQAGESTIQAELEKVLANKDYGIIVTNEYMLNRIDWRLRKKLDSIAYPVVIPMPDYTGKSTEGDEIRNLIKRALGFDLGAKKQEKS